MFVRVKKHLSQELQKQGYNPISQDANFDVFTMENTMNKCFSSVNKSDYMIMNGMSFVKEISKEVK